MSAVNWNEIQILWGKLNFMVGEKRVIKFFLKSLKSVEQVNCKEIICKLFESCDIKYLKNVPGILLNINTIQFFLL